MLYCEKEGKKLTTTGKHGIMYQFLLAFLRIFQNFPGTLGEKIPKMLVFTRVYVCVKAKLTFVSYFGHSSFHPSTLHPP